MTHKELAINALTLGPPQPGLVPTIELQFQLVQEMFGREYHQGNCWKGASAQDRNRMLRENAELLVEVAERLDYCVLMDTYSPDEEGMIENIRLIREMVGDEYLHIVHGDGTYAIPNGENMVQCSLLQTGTEEEIVENCKYVLEHGMPGGGYIYSTTNVAFKGLPLERYMLVLEMREKHGRYPIPQ
ncbi:MAG: hypothetical protein AB1696_23035 [Planctomycetota bacterium]